MVRTLDTSIALAVESFSKSSRVDEQLERAKDLGMLAHEIRNAVSNALVGFELIRQGRAAADGVTADVVQRALSRIGALVADAIAAVQMVDGVVTQREWIPLDRIFTQSTQDLSKERGIRIAVHLDEEILIDADERLIFSAVSNLLQFTILIPRTPSRSRQTS